MSSSTPVLPEPEPELELELGREAASRLKPSGVHTVVSAAIVLAPVVLVSFLAWSHRWVADDAFIHFRVVENIVDGNGPVFNAGQRVEASTSPLWVLLLAPFAAAGGLPLEWWAVLLGMVGTAVGVLCAQRASLALDVSTPARLAVPLGALVFVSLLPVWEFATSGLENGLGFAWQAGCFLLLVHAARPAGSVSRSRVALVGVAISLGTLIRPDFGIFWAFYGFCLLLFAPSGRRNLAVAAVSLVALPAAYQVFRMGYFASLAPSAALAKEASSSRTSVGYDYFRDFVGPYVLALPLAVLAGVLIVRICMHSGQDRRTQLLLIGPVVVGVVHAAYVVRVGGDFMHGRMLLPSLFCVLLPMFAVRASRLVLGAAAVVIVPWAVVCVTDLRPEYATGDGLSPAGYIADERAFYLSRAATLSDEPPRNPVTIEDYGDVPFTRSGWRDAASANGGVRDVHAIAPDGQAVRVRMLRPEVKHDGVTGTGNIGMYGYAAGNNILVADPNGLADVVAAHLRLDRRGRPGHEKELLPVWFYARYAQPPLGLETLRPSDEQAAMRALSCGELREMIAATSEPLTVRRFISNVADAPRFWTVRVPNDPFEAAVRFCDRPA